MAILPDLPALAVTTAAGGGGDNTSEKMRQRRLLAHVVLAYDGSFDAGGTVTISHVTPEGNEYDLITITGNTDGCFTPSAPQMDDAGAATGLRVPFTITGQLKVTVAGAGAALAPAVTAEFIFD